MMMMNDDDDDDDDPQLAPSKGKFACYNQPDVGPFPCLFQMR